MDIPLFEMKIGAAVNIDMKPRLQALKRGEGIGSYPFSRLKFYQTYLEVLTPVIFSNNPWRTYKLEYTNIVNFERKWWLMGTMVNHHQPGIPKYIILRGLAGGWKLHKILKERVKEIGIAVQFAN